MLNEQTGKKSQRPSALLLATLLVALLLGGAIAFLLMSDSRLAGEPVARLALTPEPTAPAADKLLRTKTSDEEAAEATPAASPPPPAATAEAADKLTPDEQTLLDAAKRVQGADADDNAGDDIASQVKIVGAESVSGASDATPKPEIIKLRPVPDPALTAQGRQGLLPIVAKDGRKAWQVYARPLPKGLPPGPRIALVVSGMGISDSATSNAIEKLPPEVTLSFAPYGSNLQSWIKRARDAGHEVLLELPMEPFGYPQNDPGPYTMLTNLQTPENLSRLEWLMSRFTGYAGVMNYQGARFTSSQTALKPVLTELKARGLMYVDNGASPRSVAPKLAGEVALPVAVATSMIDPVQSPQVIDRSLTALETVARQSGVALGVATSFPVTVDGIVIWAQTLKAKGITLVPVTATAATPSGTN